jgi:hypothetical protein
MENGRRTNWITEKLIDCLVSRTIPIYWGAPNVGEYFDSNAILTFETFSDLSVILRSLTPDFYQKRLASIDHNLQEAMKYTDVHARINDIIRRRLSDYTWTPSNKRTGQEIRERMLR